MGNWLMRSVDDEKVEYVLLSRWTRMVKLWTVTLSPHMRSSGGQVGRSMALVTNLATSAEM